MSIEPRPLRRLRCPKHPEVSHETTFPSVVAYCQVWDCGRAMQEEKRGKVPEDKAPSAG